MKLYIFLFLLVVSCAPHYDYFTLGYVQKGMMKASILQDFNIDEEDIHFFASEDEKYGSPDEINVVDIEKPIPKKNEILVVIGKAGPPGS